MKIMGKGIKNVKRIKLHWGMSIQLQIVPQQTIKIGLKIKESEEFFQDSCSNDDETLI